MHLYDKMIEQRPENLHSSTSQKHMSIVPPTTPSFATGDGCKWPKFSCAVGPSSDWKQLHMTVKSEAMVVVASTFIATESEHRTTEMNIMIAMPTKFSCQTPSSRDKRFTTDSNGAPEHPRKAADVKSVPD